MNTWQTESYCVCNQGWYGNDCSQGPFCLNNPCGNHGQCSVYSDNNRFNYTCVCDIGYFGSDCSINPCSNSNICENGGTCASVIIPDGTVSFYCKCPSNYFGRKCNYNIHDFGLKLRISKVN